MVAVVAGVPLRRAEPQPVCRLIAGTLKTVSLHKGFQRMHGMPILGLPVNDGTKVGYPEVVTKKIT